MTNTVLLIVTLSTNWLPISIDQPIGEGRVQAVPHEVGIVTSNRWARFEIWDGFRPEGRDIANPPGYRTNMWLVPVVRSNQVLISSEILPVAPMVRRVKAMEIRGGLIYTNPPGWITISNEIILQ